MEVHLITPLTWSAALVPALSNCSAELVVREPDNFPEFDETLVACILHVHSANLIASADWIESLATKKRLNDISQGYAPSPLLVVVGTDAVRYQWKLRELGVTDVAAHVWEVPRLASLVHRHLGRLPRSDDRWPSWIHARLAES